MIKGFNVQADAVSHYSTVSFVYHLIFMKAIPVNDLSETIMY